MGQIKMPYFSWHEPNVNYQTLLFKLIYIRFDSWKVRLLDLALGFNFGQNSQKNNSHNQMDDYKPHEAADTKQRLVLNCTYYNFITYIWLLLVELYLNCYIKHFAL